MTDFLWAVAFFLWYEVLTLPLRVALASTPAPEDLRRVISRAVGPAVLVLPIWFAGHASGWMLDRTAGLVWYGIAMAMAGWPWTKHGSIARLLGYQERSSSLGAVRRQILPDAITVALFLFFVAIRRWVPEMTTYAIDRSGAEKFMNAMMFWSSWHAAILPPEDYWLAGERLVYYYWGHFHWAWVGRVGGFPAELALNLALARTVTLVWEAGYLLARAVGLLPGWASLAALAVAWAGNVSAVTEWWRTWRSGARGYDWGTYDFWKPSRAIADSVIDEFPAFSAILGDFHAHHLALPWLVTWAALTIRGPTWLGAAPADRRSPRPLAAQGRATGSWAVSWAGAGLAAALGNLWNVPVIGFVMLLTLIHGLARGRRGAKMVAGVHGGFAVLLGVAALMILGGVPHSMLVSSSPGLIEGVPLRWLPTELRSTVAQLFSMWGLPACVLAGAAVARATARPSGATTVFAGAGALILFVAGIVGPSRLPGGSAWIWIGMMALVRSLSVGRRPWLPGRAAWLGLAACLILAGLELIFIDDAYAGAYERYNTYFKLSYPVWPALVVTTVAAARHVWRLPVRTRRHATVRWGLRTGLAAALALAMVYPVCAIPARLLSARRGDDPPRRPTLDGVGFLAHRPPYSEEAPILAWIRRHVPPRQVVAEGRGADAYGYGGRVASLAGRPVPLGWPHHERQWRGRPGHQLTARRQTAIDALYQAPSAETLRRRAAELDVRWILYGIVERERYGDPRQDGRILGTLREAARLAAAFPQDQPTTFLFQLRLAEHE